MSTFCRLRPPAAILAAAILAVAALAGPAATPSLAAPPERPQVIGGAALGLAGVVDNPAPGVPPVPASVAASSWLVADLDTGQVLAAKGAHLLFRPASTLKVLTALTLIPRLNPATRVLALARDTDVIGSRVGLVPGQYYTVRQLFTSLLVVSGNDSANVLAHAAGGAAATLAAMNAEARQLQARDTTARTVSGLDAPGQRTSAYDLALIARQALKLPAFDAYVATRRSFMPTPSGGHFEIDSHNPLLGSYPGTFGVKNGYTTKADASYIGAAARGGHRIIVTLLHAYPVFGPAARALLTWGFAADGRVVPVGTLVPPLSAAPSGTAANRRHTGGPAQPAAPRRLTAAGTAAPASWAGTSVQIAAGLLAALVVLRTRVLLRRRRRHRVSHRRWRGGQAANGKSRSGSHTPARSRSNRVNRPTGKRAS